MNVLSKTLEHSDDVRGPSKASIGLASPLPKGALKFNGRNALLRPCERETQQRCGAPRLHQSQFAHTTGFSQSFKSREGRGVMGRPCGRMLSSDPPERPFKAGFSALIDLTTGIPLNPGPSPAPWRGEPILGVARRNSLLLLATLLLGVASPFSAWAQSPDRATVSFSDPARPRLVKVSLLSGGITVRGYEGKDVLVEVKNKEGKSDDGSNRSKRAQGMKRIKPAGSGLIVEEENNTVTVSTGVSEHSVNLVVQVPVNTSLKLNAVDDGDILVENVTGEIEANNVGGDLKLTQVSGTVIAHTVDGDVTVSLVKVNTDKAMSFSSLDGDIDVTFPSDFKASVKMHTNNGEIYSDFDVQSNVASRAPVIKDERSKGGKYSVHIDKGTTGTINGGGPEVQFKTFDGDIYIRKAK